MNTYLTKAAVALKPFQKLTYLLAIILFVNIFYQLVFSSMPSEVESHELRLNLLVIIWVILLNLMIQIYSSMAIASQSHRLGLAKIKDKIYQGFLYLLSFGFIIITMAALIVTFKMMRL